jgi:hypothetical protein
MNRKIVKPVAITAGAVALVGVAALVTALSYVTSAGDQELWSVKLMKRSGLEGNIARRAWKKAHKDD